MKLRLGVVGAVIGGPPVASLFISPSVKPSVCQLPVKGSLLVRFTSLHIKPALKGEVAMSVSELTEGL